MVRITHRAHPVLRIVIATPLVIWTIMYAYLIAFTDMPDPCIFLFILPIPLMAWVFSLVQKGIIWEADQIGLRNKLGNKVHELSWSEVTSLQAMGDESRGYVFLQITDKDGQLWAKLVKSYGRNIEDFRILYEASSYYLRHHLAICSNVFGWEPKLPSISESEEKEVPGRSFPYVSLSLLATGLIIVLIDNYKGQTDSTIFGMALGVLGIGLYLAGNLIRKSKQKT